MADPRPWTDYEKNELLAEIIKTAAPHPSVLFNVIAHHNIPLRWEDTPLPRGRSLNHCRFIFEELRRTQPPAVTAGPSGPYGPQTPLSAPPGGFKRPFSVEAPYQGGREIRPKPFPPSGMSGHIPSGEPAPKRKRGRPTKAQAQAKAAAAEAAGQAPPPASARPPQVSSPQSAPPAMGDTPGPTEEAKSSHPPVTKMPISAVLTPSAPKTASSSGSSSGKRRRTRSTRSEPEGYPMGGGVGGGVVGIPQEYESPYGLEAEPLMDTSPARSAVMRHRELHGPEQTDPFHLPSIESRTEPPLPPPGNPVAPGGSRRPGI